MGSYKTWTKNNGQCQSFIKASRIYHKKNILKGEFHVYFFYSDDIPNQSGLKSVTNNRITSPLLHVFNQGFRGGHAANMPDYKCTAALGLLARWWHP